jgi:hypothetical protein
VFSFFRAFLCVVILSIFCSDTFPHPSPRRQTLFASAASESKRECLDYFICFSLNHLNYINHQWLLYYNEHRPHQGTDIRNKVLRAEFCPALQWHPFGTSRSTRFPFASQAVMTPTDKGKIKREQRLGGHSVRLTRSGGNDRREWQLFRGIIAREQRDA